MRIRWLVPVAFLLAACGQKQTAVLTPVPGPGAPAASLLPASLRLAAKPEGAKGVGDAKKGAKDGEAVVIRGRVGGGDDPFVAGRAVMTLADTSMEACTEMPGDTCPTPWDYCCEPKDSLAAKTLTVEIHGPDGKPLAQGLRGWSGLEPLKFVVVTGTVARPDPAVLIVKATGIFVE